MNVHDAVGGERVLRRARGAVLRRGGRDLLLRPLYPDDLAESRRHLVLFLQQYWGGPTPTTRSAGTRGCASATPRS